jgi:hypothetical protein
MNRTRLSLLYVVAYLWTGGLGLVAPPQLTSTLMLSNGEYSDVMLRLAGVMLAGLAIVVTQIVRLRVRVLYPTTLIVRAFIAVALLGLFQAYGDPMFLVLLGIVGLGLV